MPFNDLEIAGKKWFDLLAEKEWLAAALNLIFAGRDSRCREKSAVPAISRLILFAEEKKIRG